MHKNIPRNFSCTDCGTDDYTGFMLRNDVWNTVALKKEILCMPCLSKRLGRELQITDFTEAPINTQAIYAEEFVVFKGMTTLELIQEREKRQAVEENDIVYRLKKRAEIRRQINTRKSVIEGKPDRISDLLEEAANEIISLRSAIQK